MERRLRLHRAEDFGNVRQQGRSHPHRWLMLNVLPNGLAHNRYGIITSKRLGKAVTRNRVRRLLREILRQLNPGLRTGFDVVIVARPAIVGQPFEAVQRIVRQLVMQSGLLLVESDVV